jgi:hypothetical protein
LGFRTRCIETGQETLSVDADARVAALEIELAAKRRRLWILFERIEAKPVVRAGRPDRTIVGVLTVGRAAERGADLPDCAIGLRHAGGALWRGLWIARVSATQETTAIAQRSVGNTDITGVVAAAGEPQ